MQTAKQNFEREKQLTKKLKDQVIIDNKNIMDLNRQVREMERILKKKNPDSVSALILTANSENDKLYAEKIKLLDDRIMFLENDIKLKENMAEIKLSEIEKKYIDMKDKYSSQVTDLQQKLKQFSDIEFEKKKFNETATQTVYQNLESRGSESNLSFKLNNNKSGPKSKNLKEDAHLIATIRGLKQELSSKEKAISKVTKEFQELQKSNRKLQKEREKLLNDRRNTEKTNCKILTSSDSKLSSFKKADLDSLNLNFCQNSNFMNEKKLVSTHKPLDLSQVNDKEYNKKLKKLMNENGVLKEELSRINKDFMMLKNKRLHDLNLLQEEHEKEVALIVKEYSMTVKDSKTFESQVRQLISNFFYSPV